VHSLDIHLTVGDIRDLVSPNAYISHELLLLGLETVCTLVLMSTLLVFPPFFTKDGKQLRTHLPQITPPLYPGWNWTMTR